MTDSPRTIARRIVLETLVEISRDETRPLAVRAAAAAEATERVRRPLETLVEVGRKIAATWRTIGQSFAALSPGMRSAVTAAAEQAHRDACRSAPIETGRFL